MREISSLQNLYWTNRILAAVPWLLLLVFLAIEQFSFAKFGHHLNDYSADNILTFPMSPLLGLHNLFRGMFILCLAIAPISFYLEIKYPLESVTFALGTFLIGTVCCLVFFLRHYFI